MRGRPREKWHARCEDCAWTCEGDLSFVSMRASLHWAQTEHRVGRKMERVEIPPIDVTINFDDEQFQRILDDVQKEFARLGGAFRAASSDWAQGMAPGATPNATPGLQALGLARGATAAEVRSRYRAKLREIHPDAGGSGDGKAMVRLQDDYARALREVGG